MANYVFINFISLVPSFITRPSIKFTRVTKKIHGQLFTNGTNKQS